MICVGLERIRRRYRRREGGDRRRGGRGAGEEEERNGEEEAARVLFKPQNVVYGLKTLLPRNFLGIFRLGIFRGNSEETLIFLGILSEYSEEIQRNQILCFLGISSEIPRDIPRISFSVGMSVRIPLFSCSDST
ncbi:hypothetical protein YC2023_079161 [Brassica napus]